MEQATLGAAADMQESLSRLVRAGGLPLGVVGGTGSVQVGAAEEPRRCTTRRLYVGGYIPCATARTMAARLGLRMSQMGKLLELLHVRVRACELGCFP